MMRAWILGVILLAGVVHAEETKFAVKVSEQEGKAIEEIVTTLGTSSAIALGFKRSHLKELGHGLKGIGSLHFLGYIFSHSELIAHMKTIHKSSLKWNGFMDGLKPGFERDPAKLLEEIPAFAKLVGADSSKLEAAAKERKWDDFVATLIN